MNESVDDVFRRLEDGRLRPRGLAIDDGWEATLPGGQTVTRSQLQVEARPLIELGADAVPDLLPWVDHRNAALRYVAWFALGEITGERPEVVHFDDDDTDGQRARAVAQWRSWYEARQGRPALPP